MKRMIRRKLPKGMLPFVFLFALAGCYTPPKDGILIEERDFTKAVNASHGDPGKIQNLQKFTLAEARKIALANNPNYQSALYAIRSAKMRYYQALGAYSPVVNSGFAIGNAQFNGNGSSELPSQLNIFYTVSGVQASWVLFDGLEREFCMLAAKRGVKMQEYLHQNTARILLQAIGIVYCDIHLARTQEAIAQADAEFQKKQYNDAMLRFRNGDVSRSDVLNFEGRWKQAEMSRITARNQHQLALFALAVLLGYPEGTIPSDARLETIQETSRTTLPAVEIYLDNALNHRPDLNAVRESLNIMRYQYYQTYGGFLPKITAQTAYLYGTNSIRNGNEKFLGDFYSGGGIFNYGGTATWNLFRGFISYNRSREAKAILDGAYFQSSGKWLEVVQEIRDSYTTLNNNLEMIRLARESRDILLEQRNLVEKEYRYGDVDLNRMNSAQTNYVVSENQLISAVITAYKSRIQLESAAGMLTELEEDPKVKP